MLKVLSMRSQLAERLQPVLGVALAVALGFASTYLFAGSGISHLLPLAFIAVLFALSRRYGMAVAIIGSLLCAFIFAHWLFEPTGNWHVEDFAARRNLVWMVLGTIALSYLFAPTRPEKQS
jgi:K+-sensing histidine kinase KdpD